MYVHHNWPITIPIPKRETNSMIFEHNYLVSSKNFLSDHFMENWNKRLKERWLEYRGHSRLTALYGFSSPSRFHCPEKNQWFSMDYSNSVGRLLNETLKGEIKSMTLEIHDGTSRWVHIENTSACHRLRLHCRKHI